MSGLNYKSLASVAALINQLIARGHLAKRDKSARSIEVVNSTSQKKLSTNQILPSQERWLIEKIDHAFKQLEEQSLQIKTTSLTELSILLESLKILGLEEAAASFLPRYSNLKNIA